MFEPFLLPAIGIWVSRGLFGMYDVPAKGARLVCAKNGAAPVGVGPLLYQYESKRCLMYMLTGEDLRLGLEVLRNMVVRRALGRGNSSTNASNNSTKSERPV